MVDLIYEPQTALVAEENGLAALQLIIAQAPRRICPDGILLVEHGYDQSKQVQQLMQQAGFINIAAHCDLAAIPRFVSAQWSEE